MGKIEIKGPIISDSDQRFYDWFGIPATSPSVVNKALAAAMDGEEMEVIINSGGGSVFAGSEMYTALRSYKGNVTAKVVGVAASAASVIAMGANKLLLSPTARLMIHRASTYAGGNKNDFEHVADVLSGIDKSIARAYEAKTKISASDLLEMMSKETWLGAEEAKELGFSDGIMFEDEVDAVNVQPDASGMLPQAVIEKMRAELAKPPEPTPDPVPEPDNKLNLAKARAQAMLVL